MRDNTCHVGVSNRSKRKSSVKLTFSLAIRLQGSYAHKIEKRESWVMGKGKFSEFSQ